MLRPSERWYWSYSQTRDRLILDLSDDAQFCTPFSAGQLLHIPNQQALSMAEAEAFWTIDNSLQALELPAAVRLELCLTALSCQFMQQQAHKSWYFQQASQCEAQLYDVVTLRGLISQYALVVAAEQDCVSCLLLGELSSLAGKMLPRLSVIRVLRNRISALDVAIPYRHIA
ncbi:MAG: cell division protein ZapC [Gammaproteobacteria bacterium]|nr:cell division protein ZapC [Gammaproteobacteria bacterium]